MDLGKRFKRFREKRGLTQNQAAELIGVNNYQIGNYETAKQELYIKEFTLGGTYSYAYTYLSSKYTDDNIHKLTYVNSVEGTLIEPLITNDVCIAEYDNSPGIQHITDMFTWLPLYEQKPWLSNNLVCSA